MSFPAQLKYIILTILFTIATVNFARTTLSILQSSKRLEGLKGEVKALEDKKTGLQGDLEYKKTDDYIEERARNALNLIKPGEKVYVSGNVLAKNSEQLDLPSENENKSNIQRWYELFF